MSKIRLFENFHVVLWIIKDTCWLLHLTLAGTLMIFPTLGMAVHIAWRTRHSRLMFLPNAAVCLWLSANISWMLGEFYTYDLTLIATLFFAGGTLIMCYYFITYYLRKRKAKNG